jgi:hypothetical protein
VRIIIKYYILRIKTNIMINDRPLDYSDGELTALNAQAFSIQHRNHNRTLDDCNDD